MRNQYTGPMDIAERFWRHVEKLKGENACWVWRGATTIHGYGQFVVRDLEGKYRKKHAHRIAYEMEIGPIPGGHDCCHACDNRPCVRPDHLFAATRKQNMEDCVAKGRTATGDRHWSRRLPDIPKRGEENHFAKMDEYMARSILQFFMEGRTRREIADELALPYTRVADVVAGRSWKHLQPRG